MHSLLSYQTTLPVLLDSVNIERQGVQLLIQREDLNHPHVSGNKWWKLKYNLIEARRGFKTVITFGGAYSNHIYATAAACKELELPVIGVIRGERTEPLNATLQFAEECGMQLAFVSREEYRLNERGPRVQQMLEQYESCYVIPEGGTNEWALKGCAEWAIQLEKAASFDYVCLASGTAGTMAGLARGTTKNILGFSVLKNGSFLQDAFHELSGYASHGIIETHYDFGGYAKVKRELIHFMAKMDHEFSIPLDPVYTAKALFGTLDLIEKGFFPRGSTVLFLHTGGLQGRAGFNFE